MLLKLSLLLLAIYIFGILLTVILFKWNIRKFLNSELSKKIILWIPITIVFLFFAFANNGIQFCGFLLLLLGVYYDQIKIIYEKNLFPRFLWLSLFPFTIAFLHLPLLISSQQNETEILILLAVTASLSDVGAFFFGKFWGIHRLPTLINNKKSWEGVFGQIVGAFIGILLLKIFIFSEINILWFLPIGLGSAIGDMYNSFLKREAGIKNWSNTLPGHGGFTDRFASLAFSTVLFYYFTILSR